MEAKVKQKGAAFKLLAIVCAFALVVGQLTVVTSAYAADEATWPAPTEPTSTSNADGQEYVTSAGKRIVESYADILGISNVTMTPNAANPITLTGDDEADLAAMEASTRTGIFGTSVNENPNPWLANLMYNAYAGVNGLDKVTDYTQYTMLSPNGGPTAADTQVDDTYGTSKTLAMRPDILLGYGGDPDNNPYVPYVEEINSWRPGDEHYLPGDETYSPKYVQPLMNTMAEGALTLYALAEASEQAIEESKDANGVATKATRYDESAMDIAVKYETYMLASQYYVMSKIDSGELEKKTVGLVRSVDTDTNTVTFLTNDASNSGTRYNSSETLRFVIDNIIDVNGHTDAVQDDEYVGTAQDVMDCDVIIITTDNTDQGAGDNVSADEWTSLLKTLLETNGYFDSDMYPDIFTQSPQVVLNLARNSADKVANYGIYIGFVYPDVLSPVDMMAYFYNEFYHIKSSELQSCVNVLMEYMSLPTGVTLDISNYSAADIEAKFAEGLQYYVDNQEEIDALSEDLIPTEHIVLPEKTPDTPEPEPEPGPAAPDKTELEAAVNEAEAIDVTTATLESIEALDTAIEAAKAVLNNESATQDDVDAALADLQAAVNGLEQMTLFTDVSDPGQYYYSYVYYMAKLGLITGYNATTFGVGDSMSRAQVVTIMWRYCDPDGYANYNESAATNTTDLPDNPNGMYYTGAVNWAVENGVVTGNLHEDGTYTFNPDDSVTFEQLATIVARYALGGTEEAADYDTASLDKGAFTDKDAVEEFARGSMSWAIDNDVITGNDNNDGTWTLAPLEDVARERATTVLARSIANELI